MWTVPMPADPAGPFYLSCVKGVRDKDLRDRLGKAAHSVVSADIRYREAGADGGFGGLCQADFELPDVTAREMTWLYENRMVGKKAPDRPGPQAAGYTTPSGRRARRAGARSAGTGT